MKNKRKNKNTKEINKSEVQTKEVIPNWINYENKVPILTPEFPNINLVNANDMNSIKWTVMQGIPIFWEGQTITFASSPRLDKFLLQFPNLVPSVDYIINPGQLGYLYVNSRFNEDLKAVGSDGIDIGIENLPIDKLFLQNTIKNQFLGKMLFFQSTGGWPTDANFPTSGGSRTDSSFAPTVQYFVQMNQTGRQRTITNYPKGLSVCLILFLRNIYAEDIKKD